jgi:hypothetical protein
MSSYPQIQQTDDTREPCRVPIVRFIVLDYTILSSLKSLADHAYKEMININLENPYSIDIDQEAINVAIDRLRFSSIHWNNLFSNNVAVRQSETEKVQEFVAYYFDVERRFLEVAHLNPNRNTDDPNEMTSIVITTDEPSSMLIRIEGVTGKNASPKLTILKGTNLTEKYDGLKAEKVTDDTHKANYYLYCNESEERKSKIAKAYLDYRTDLFLQSILSFVIRYPDKINELVLPSNTDDPIKAEFELATRIENVTSIFPSYDIVKLLMKIFAALASPLASENDIMNKENYTLIPQKQFSQVYNLIKKEEIIPLQQPETIIDSAGLTAIRSELSGLLAVDLAEGMDVFEDIIGICSALFNDNLSEDMMFLDSQLPTVKSRFQTSQATPDQQVHYFRASDIVTQLLENVITKERMSDLHALSANLKSTSLTTHFFRSLNDLARYFNSNSQSRVNLNKSWAECSWYFLYDDTKKLYRLDFMFLIWWMLTTGTDNRLYKIYEYCNKRTRDKDHESGLVPAAIFPGSLAEPLNGIVSLSTLYESQRTRNKQTGEILKEPKGIEKLMPEYRGRAW